MIERVFVVAGELGLHARPAGEFVRVAGRFESEIQVSKDGEWVNGNSVLSLLTLAAAQGTKLTIRADGPDADAALAALGEVVERPDEPPVT